MTRSETTPNQVARAKVPTERAWSERVRESFAFV
jgi:hypothetical protein